MLTARDRPLRLALGIEKMLAQPGRRQSGGVGHNCYLLIQRTSTAGSHLPSRMLQSEEPIVVEHTKVSRLANSRFPSSSFSGECTAKLLQELDRLSLLLVCIVTSGVICVHEALPRDLPELKPRLNFLMRREGLPLRIATKGRA